MLKSVFLFDVLPSGLLHHPPRAAKPPVSRVRLGFMEMMTNQHELSAIQEVETPANTSQTTGTLSRKDAVMTDAEEFQLNVGSVVSRSRGKRDVSFTHCKQRPAAGVRIITITTCQSWDELREIHSCRLEGEASDGDRNMSRILRLWCVQDNVNKPRNSIGQMN